MKASSNLLMRAAAMLLAVSACIALSACTKLPNSSQPTPAPSPTATTEPSTTPVLTEEEKQALYDEYFAEEREFVKIPQTDDGYYILAATSNIVNNSGEKESLGETRITGYLLKMKNDIWAATYISDIYVDSEENIVTQGADVYAIQDGNKIIKCDRNLENIQLLYTSPTSGMHGLRADGTIAYFTIENTIYRLHIPSGIVDQLYTSEKEIVIAGTTFKAVSNYKIRFAVLSDEYLAYMQTERYQKYLETGLAEYDFVTPIEGKMLNPLIYDTQTKQISYDQSYYDETLGYVREE